MPMKRSEEYPEHEHGTVPYVVTELMRRDTRTMRRASLDGGMASDSIRNICRGAARSPRSSTLAGLAKTFGVNVRVIRGQDPLPEPEDQPSMDASPPSADATRRPTKLRHAAAHSFPPRPASDTSLDVRRIMSRAVHQAVMDAIAEGLDAETALKAATVSAALAASGGGMESSKALRIVELVAEE